jgi:hypothetical protein
VPRRSILSVAERESLLSLPAKQFSVLRESRALALPIEVDCDRYIHDRLALLEQRLTVVNSLAAADELPDAVITESGLKVTPLTNSIPADADELARQAYTLLPRVKITELPWKSIHGPASRVISRI